MDAISTGALHAAIAAVCPIVGLSLGKLDDRSTWVIDFDPAATAASAAVCPKCHGDIHADGPDPLDDGA
jgi:hypothetical protein